MHFSGWGMHTGNVVLSLTVAFYPHMARLQFLPTFISIATDKSAIAIPQ